MYKCRPVQTLPGGKVKLGGQGLLHRRPGSIDAHKLRRADWKDCGISSNQDKTWLVCSTNDQILIFGIPRLVHHDTFATSGQEDLGVGGLLQV